MAASRWIAYRGVIGLAWMGAAPLAYAADGMDLSVPAADVTPGTTTRDAGTSQPPRTAIGDYFANWSPRVAAARASQPSWSSPLITTTSLLEERARYDIAIQHAGNGSDTANYGGGKGFDLIVGPTEEVQIGDIPYVVHTTPNGKGQYEGFADWPSFRFKQRLASSPDSGGDYIVAAWLQLQAPTGIQPLTNHAYTLLPALGFGKGFGPVVLQGTFGATIPTAYQSTLGTQINANLALQYHVLDAVWPQIEASWTSYYGGLRDGKHQLYLTPGVVLGKFSLTDTVKLTFGVGYQTAIAPTFRSKPLLPSYDHAWVSTVRLSF